MMICPRSGKQARDHLTNRIGHGGCQAKLHARGLFGKSIFCFFFCFFCLHLIVDDIVSR